MDTAADIASNDSESARNVSKSGIQMQVLREIRIAPSILPLFCSGAESMKVRMKAPLCDQ